MRRILIVVDMQNDFVDGALGTGEARLIVHAVVNKIKSYKKEDVFATLDTHADDYLSTQEGRNLPVPHCIKGTPGWQLVPEIDVLIDPSRRFEKPTFGSLKLAEFLKAENAKEPISVELVGLCTDICVISNALLIKANLPETEIAVDKNCCAGVSVHSHEAALEAMACCQVKIL